MDMPSTDVKTRLTDIFLLQLAREIAINHYTIDEIKRRFNVTPSEWSRISEIPRFHELLEMEIMGWHSAKNSHERVKLKSAALLEEWLEEAARRLYDRGENLPAKVELAKLVARVAGMGLEKMGAESVGDRFSVTINLGAANAPLTFEKQAPPITIEAKAIDL